MSMDRWTVYAMKLGVRGLQRSQGVDGGLDRWTVDE
jgi:hypothetical protein